MRVFPHQARRPKAEESFRCRQAGHGKRVSCRDIVIPLTTRVWSFGRIVGNGENARKGLHSGRSLLGVLTQAGCGGC